VDLQEQLRPSSLTSKRSWHHERTSKSHLSSDHAVCLHAGLTLSAPVGTIHSSLEFYINFCWYTICQMQRGTITCKRKSVGDDKLRTERSKMTRSHLQLLTHERSSGIKQSSNLTDDSVSAGRFVHLWWWVMVVCRPGSVPENAVNLWYYLCRDVTVALYVAVLEMTIDCMDDSDNWTTCSTVARYLLAVYKQPTIAWLIIKKYFASN